MEEEEAPDASKKKMAEIEEGNEESDEDQIEVVTEEELVIGRRLCKMRVTGRLWVYFQIQCPKYKTWRDQNL